MKRNDKLFNSLFYILASLEAQLDEYIARDQDMFKCLHCGKTARTKQNIRYHVETHLGLKHPCTICGKEFKTTNSLTTHYSNSHRQ